MRRRAKYEGLAALALVLSQAGCLSQIAAGSTAGIVARGSVALQRQADPEFVEAAIPGSASTLEALMITIPDNAQLRETLMRSYCSFGFGFMVEHMEDAQSRDDVDTADHYRRRATAAFLRGRTIGWEIMSIWEPDDGGVEGHRRNIDQWRSYLRGFDRREQAPHLFWTAYAWAQYISLNRDDMDALADLPMVTALGERARDLDPTYNQYGPRALLGGLQASLPASVGGRPDLARAEFEELIRLTQGRNLLYRVLLARMVAVSLQDRTLYRTQLQMVLDAGDISADDRLQNILAKRRARRYLAQIDDLFPPDETSTASPTTDSPPEPTTTTTTTTTATP